MMITEDFKPQLTADGSFTFFSAEEGETFHSIKGAREESLMKFVEPTLLRQKAQQPSLQLLDVCYGLGYNTAAALATIWEVNPNCRVELVGLELNSDVPKAALDHHLLNTWPQPIPELLAELAKTHAISANCLRATLLIGDARSTIELVPFQADGIFLDPFSPPKCPQLWTVEFIDVIARCLKPDGRLATYSCAAAVRTALMAAGLQIGSTPPVGRRSPSTVASFSATSLPPLSIQEQEHLLCRAAIPYRDPHRRDDAATILHRRLIEQKASALEPTSHWKKRWLACYNLENTETGSNRLHRRR